LQFVRGGHQSTASRAPGYTVVDSVSIALATLDEKTSQALTHEVTTQAAAGIEPAATWPSARGKLAAPALT